MTKIYLLRHGETVWNREGRMQGHRDVPMTEKGRKQVEEAAKRIREMGVSFDAVLSSPLQRARLSAEIIADALGCPKDRIEIWPELIERSFGRAEGMTLSEAKKEYPDGCYPGMETPDQILFRAKRALDRLTSSFPGCTVLIAAHGMILKAVMAAASSRAFDDAAVPIVGPASVSLIEYENGRFRLQIDETRDRWF